MEKKTVETKRIGLEKKLIVALYAGNWVQFEIFSKKAAIWKTSNYAKNSAVT